MKTRFNCKISFNGPARLQSVIGSRVIVLKSIVQGFFSNISTHNCLIGFEFHFPMGKNSAAVINKTPLEKAGIELI